MRVNRSGITSKVQTPKSKRKKRYSPLPWVLGSCIMPKYGDSKDRDFSRPTRLDLLRAAKGNSVI